MLSSVGIGSLLYWRRGLRLEKLVYVCAAARVGAREELEGRVVDRGLGRRRVEDDAVAFDGYVEEGLVRRDVEHAFCPVRGRLVADGNAGGDGGVGSSGLLGGGGGERNAAAAGGRGPEQGKRSLHFLLVVSVALFIHSDRRRVGFSEEVVQTGTTGLVGEPRWVELSKEGTRFRVAGRIAEKKEATD